MAKEVQFYVYLAQRGDGCDYTIGCGRIMKPLKAETPMEAREEIRRMVVGTAEEDYEDTDYGDSDDCFIEYAYLIPASASGIMPLAIWRSEKAEHQNDERITEKRAAELAELKRLQAKYGVIVE
jgi:hypothetical protein